MSHFKGLWETILIFKKMGHEEHEGSVFYVKYANTI